MTRSRNCCPWPPDAELLAAERIRERSMQRPLGSACKCLPLSCYARSCVSRMYMIGFLLMVVGISNLAFRLPGILENQQQSNEMKPTECTTVSSNLSASTLSCNSCGHDKGRAECLHNYPCLLVIVSYQAGATPVGNSLLYSNYDSLVQNRKCLINEALCRDWDPDSKVNSLNQKIGSVGTKFSCYYNQNNIKQVAFDVVENNTWSIWILIGCVLGSLGLILLLFSILTFPCYHNCSSTPPQEIQHELQRRQQERMAHVQQQQPLGHQVPFGQDHGQFNQAYGQPPSSGFLSQNYGGVYLNSKDNTSDMSPPPTYESATAGY